MQEHPVPQNITAYEFHLIGDMTVKQFFELLLGAGLALATYTSNLPFIFKWPIIIFSVIGGIAIAFIPIEERPLDKWVIAFFKSIYKPTKFFWKKQVKIPEVFAESTYVQTTQVGGEIPITPIQRRSRAQDYISSIGGEENPEQHDELFQAFQLQAIQLQEMFRDVTPAKGISAPKKQEITMEEMGKPNLRIQTHTLSEKIFVPESTPEQIQINPITVQKTQPEEQKIRHAVDIPNVQPIAVEKQDIQIPEKPTEEQQKQQTFTGALQQTPIYVNKEVKQAQEHVTTNVALPFPKKPTVPNVIVGMILDKDRNILENAIVEIHSSDGIPVRAMKTNMLGQFSISTPLRPGEYQISAEKDGHTFDTFSLSLQNSIVDPIEIQAKG